MVNFTNCYKITKSKLKIIAFISWFSIKNMLINIRETEKKWKRKIWGFVCKKINVIAIVRFAAGLL